jgi:hypothetical protein
VATLTYVYADSTAVLGPLATYAEPHCYDLCSSHAGRLTVPRGWSVLRLEMPGAPRLASDELSALADAVREPSTPSAQVQPEAAAEPGARRSPPAPMEPPVESGASRGHLRVLREPR